MTAALDRFDAVQAEVASLSFDALTPPQALTVKDRSRWCRAGRPPCITGSPIS
jgi:hypothetical protein